jgi:membrane complex biogenesis BtpA family protein
MAIPGPLIGVVHLLALPGSPGFRRMEDVIRRAVSDARAYADGGMDAVIVENFGDAPFEKDRLAPATVAALALCADAVRSATGLPLGINALRNDARAALGVAAATGAQFIRVNVHAGVSATDQGLIEGRAADTLRERAALRSLVRIAADVHVKHGRALHCDEIGAAARDLVERAGADAVIVTGPATGRPADLEDLVRVRRAIGRRTLIAGSGVTESTVREILAIADAVIVGTALKKAGRTRNAVDPKRVLSLVREARRKR